MNDHWKNAKLGDICEKIQDGAHHSPKKLHDAPGEGRFLYLTSKNIRTGYLKLDNVQYCEAEFHNSIYPRCNPEAGDILLTKDGANTGNVAINDLDEPFSLLSSVCLLKPDSSLIIPEFLFYYLQSPDGFKQMTGQMTGAAIKRIILKTIKASNITLPPLAEQKRIVAILDRAFAGIDKARALTEQNLKNARELFESYLQQVFSQRGEGWVNTTIGEITGGVLTGPFGSLLHKSDYIEDGIPLINPAHISAAGIVPDRKKTVSGDTAERLANYVMDEGDIVIGRRGEMGRCAVVTRNESGYLCGTGSFIIKSSKQCDSGYLVRYLRSASCVNRLEKIAGGAVMPNLSNSELSRFEIVMPPLDQQRKILELIEKLSAETDRVVSVYQRKLIGLEELKRSLLQKAFSGELANSSEEAAA